MSIQTTYWRRYTIKLIAELRRTNHTHRQIGAILGISGDAIRMIYTRWGKKYSD